MSLSHLWTSLFSLWVLSEILLVLVTRTARSSGNVQDRGSILLLWLVIAGSITAAGWTVALVPGATLHGMPWIRALALGVMVAGLAIRWTAILALGRAFSVNVAIRPQQQIYRGGLYRFVRHPSYLGLILIFLAIGLHDQNLVGLLIIVVATTAALLYRIRVEERVLQQAFGSAYADYARTTRRLLPGIY